MSKRCIADDLQNEQLINQVSPGVVIPPGVLRGAKKFEVRSGSAPDVGLSTAFSTMMAIPFVPTVKTVVTAKFNFTLLFTNVAAATFQVQYNGVNVATYQDGGHYQQAGSGGYERCRCTSYFTIDVPIAQGDGEVALQLKIQAAGQSVWFKGGSQPAWRAWAQITYWQEFEG